MVEVSDSVPERSRANQSAILSALANKTQTYVASVIGVHESTVSKMVSDGAVEKTSTFLAAAGLKVVPAEATQYDPAYIAALQELAARCLAKDKGAA